MISFRTAAERRNYWVFLLDGGFFVGGVSFVNGQTLLPGIILDRGGPAWLAAFMPSAMAVGMLSLPVFIAGWIDRVESLKRHVLLYSILQRLPYLAACVLLLLPVFGQANLLWIIALTPFLSGFLGGLNLPAFQRLYMRCVPGRLRSSNTAYRLMAGGLTGILAGWGIEFFIGHFPLALAMAALHGIALLFLTVSWVSLLYVVEERPADPATPPVPDGDALDGRRKGWVKSAFADVRELLADPGQRRNRLVFLAASILMHACFLPLPFFAAHLQKVTAQPVSFLGILAMCSMVGSAAGNLCAAWLGDRFGGRLTMALGCLCLILSLFVAPWIRGLAGVSAVYGAYFFGMMLTMVGREALLYDFGPQHRQARYLSLMSLFSMLALLASSLIGFALWSWTQSFHALAWLGAAGTLTAFVAIAILHEPRHDVARVSLSHLRRGWQRLFR